MLSIPPTHNHQLRQFFLNDIELILTFLKEMNIKVGVRVRPLNQQEKRVKSLRCVEMTEHNIRLSDLQEQQKYRDFEFDYCFWSHDQFTVNQNGYFAPITDKYADQKKVYDQIGKQILMNAWQGYHCCLFAYGQTGAGKTYTMVGYEANQGIVPRLCRQLFTKIQQNENTNIKHTVNLSMLQIYNQKIQDLLIPIGKRPASGLKIRENRYTGVYVEGLSKHEVESYEDIDNKIDQGIKNRSIASTLMNKNSSRAHTVFTIELKQTERTEQKMVEKFSVVHLVDLAGSEKVRTSGVTGDRLRQAASIGKSLSCLGVVISVLADKSMGKPNRVVPYRDSCITRILQRALGGNSKTFMICVISPAFDNHDETLSTLRYGNQCKKILNRAVINQMQHQKDAKVLSSLSQEIKTQKLGQNFYEKCKLDKTNIKQQQEQIINKKKNQQSIGIKFQNFENPTKDSKQILFSFQVPAEGKLQPNYKMVNKNQID